MEVPVTYTPQTPVLKNEQTTFLNYVNKHREELGVNPLIPEKLLTTKAILRILDLSLLPKEEFNHGAGNWLGVKSEIEKHGFTYVSEILSYKYNSIWASFNSYMNSENGHREALMDKRFRYIGLGVINYNNKVYTCIILANYNII